MDGKRGYKAGNKGINGEGKIRADDKNGRRELTGKLLLQHERRRVETIDDKQWWKKEEVR